jgi:hypothetical protein
VGLSLKRRPEIDEQGVVVAGVGSHAVEIGARAVELVVGDVLHTEPGVEPWPQLWSVVLAKELIGYLGCEAVAIREERAVAAVQNRIGAAPGVEVAAGQDKLAIGSVGQRRLRAEGVERAQARLDKNPNAMRTRRETVEHPFGTRKMRMGATHFLCVTLPKVATEMALCVLGYNLTRVLNIVGMKPLLAAVRA